MENINNDETLWVEKYRPQKIDDCILPKEIKENFKQFVEKNEFPNMLISGGPGMGKTTIAKALCNELGYDNMVVNASLSGDINTLRNDIQKYASTVSLLDDGYKVIILDEADYLTHATQPALRGFIEEFSKNCRFILTCNFKNKIIEPIRNSRLANIDLVIPTKEKPKLMMGFMERVMQILDNEGIEYDKKVIAEFIGRFFPDFRRTLNELQRYSVINGKIDTGILANIGNVEIETLVKSLKAKDFSAMRKWVGENTDLDPNNIFRKIYDTMYTYMEPSSIPQTVVTLGDYQYKAAFCADKEINLVACLTELMVNVEFK